MARFPSDQKKLGYYTVHMTANQEKYTIFKISWKEKKPQQFLIEVPNWEKTMCAISFWMLGEWGGGREQASISLTIVNDFLNTKKAKIGDATY